MAFFSFHHTLEKSELSGFVVFRFYIFFLRLSVMRRVGNHHQ